MHSPVNMRWLSVFSVHAIFLALATGSGCSGTRRGTAPSGAAGSGPVFQDNFEHLELVQQHWSAVLPETAGAISRIENGEARLTSPSRAEVALVHPLEVNAIGGRRVRVSARVRTDSADIDAYVVVAFGRSPQDFRPRARTSPGHATAASLATVVDVDADVSRAELSLVLHGQGNAWFDDVSVEVLGPQPARSGVSLPPRQLQNLEALTRAAAVIHYRHPSDQAAELDWNAFFPAAIDRVMRAADEDSLLAELRELFAPIGPTVEFSRTPVRASIDSTRPDNGHLVRWRHEGLGPQASYKSWREGQGVDLASFDAGTSVDLRAPVHCKKSQLRAAVRGVSDDGEVRIYANIESGGHTVKRFDRRVTAADSSVSLDLVLPEDFYRVRLGFELRGRSAVTLEALSLACDGVATAIVDVEHAGWERHGSTDLYAWEPLDCGTSRCLTVARRPLETRFSSTRDVLDTEIVDHVWLHAPLAVWSNGARTLPEPRAWVPPVSGAASPAAERIATLASAWIVLSMFYPGFQDQKIDWAQELPGALTSGAAARSTDDTYIALSRLIAKLHDGHARAIHPDFPIDGMLPIAMRRFGNKLVVVGGFGDYARSAPIGSEVIAVDHVPAMQAYQGLRERVSSSTEGWEGWIVPLWLTLGRQGTFSLVHVRIGDAKEADLLLPRLSRDLYGSLVREPRPEVGAVLAPGIHYVDLEDLKPERWQAALASLVQARAIILDMRGYPSNAVFPMLGHFIDKAVQSPTWQTPILESSGYRTSSSTINPMKPRIDAKLVVLLDGRAASAAETFLQIIHDNHLAVFVGETSAGTNGTPNVVGLPGGFTLRFTGQRVLFADGSALQGRGIVPDVVVHPTLEGVRARQDEILEAGIRVAGRLIAR